MQRVKERVKLNVAHHSSSLAPLLTTKPEQSTDITWEKHAIDERISNGPK